MPNAVGADKSWRRLNSQPAQKLVTGVRNYFLEFFNILYYGQILVLSGHDICTIQWQVSQVSYMYGCPRNVNTICELNHFPGVCHVGSYSGGRISGSKEPASTSLRPAVGVGKESENVVRGVIGGDDFSGPECDGTAGGDCTTMVGLGDCNDGEGIQ
jgi:hypothetical protein